MAGLNKILLIGGLTKDPETRYSQSGSAVTTINLATSEKWTDKKTNEQKEETQYHRIVFFNKQAENIGRYCSKGSQLYIEGKLKHRSYEQDGIKKYISEIHALSFQFLSSKQNSQQQSTGQQNQGGFQSSNGQGNFQQPNQQQQFQQGQQRGNFGGGAPAPMDSDIPFAPNIA